MGQADIGAINNLIWYFLPIAEGFLRGYCFYRFLDPFCFQRKKSAVWGSGAYFLTILLFYTMGFSKDLYVIYGMASLVLFVAVCWMDRRNYRQKLFLTITFFSLSWFGAAMAEILYDALYDTILGTDYMQSHPDMSTALYVAMCVHYLFLEFVFTNLGIWQVVRVYKNKTQEMGKKELIMLTLPSFMGVIGYEIMRYYRVFYALKEGRMEGTYDGLMLLFCAVSSLTILVVILLYQEIRTRQEESQQAEFLKTQINSIKHHMEQVEGLYHNIRSIRHDMTNHILTLERLYGRNQWEEAEIYKERLIAELTQTASRIESGNPVINVILQEWAEEAERKGISFYSEFYYPADSEIDVFDVSVILNNGLQNAVEHMGEGKQLSIVSYRENNAYMIEICNSFTGTLQWNAESGLPVTSKEKMEGHGYGLSNIRKMAGKYAGDIDITLKNEEFCLCIMMMIE